MESEPHGEGRSMCPPWLTAEGGLAEVKVLRQQEGFLREGSELSLERAVEREPWTWLAAWMELRD